MHSGKTLCLETDFIGLNPSFTLPLVKKKMVKAFIYRKKAFLLNEDLLQ